ALPLATAQPKPPPSRVAIAPDNVLLVNGRPVFPIGFTFGPPPGALSPRGVEGLRELREAGALFLRTGPTGSGAWSDAYLPREREWMDAAARNGMFTMPWLKELAAVRDRTSPVAEKLRRVVRLLKDHPGLGVWKGEDEPEWGKKPVPPLRTAYEIIHELDPDHPVWIVQAPRGTVASLKLYNDTYDIGGIDVYPVSYPPGVHSNESNKEISMVGDFSRRIADVVEGKKPFWMTLQIAFSGTVKPGKTLRFPTYPEQRFMAYQAVINGARGLVYFGGQLPATLNERDAKLGWNWTYWDRVLRPVIEELGDRSPLAPALTAPASSLPVRLESASPGVEYTVREAGKDLYLLACKREGGTLQARVTGLPAGITRGEVMFEAPRQVTVTGGAFTDWFGPFEVHVYRFPRP
ncbi:MAG TPA: hypothetical protein VFU47_02990, partial [Armatimonadota bacterium]|nr:hypothetical protein [Armatimonadota bacterium]